VQQKEFDIETRSVVPPAGKIDAVIENTGLSKINFHGIRFEGTVQVDYEEPLSQYLSGFISLMCIPNDQIVIPTLLSGADLNDSNSFIIGVIQYQLHIQNPTEGRGAQSQHVFSITPKTSRSCMKGGKIVGQVSNDSPVGDVVFSAILSTFETY